MAKAEQAEENHWPGFVDALSTIVMVVTFLLIILAIAIFVLSLKIVDVRVENPVGESTNLDKTEVITIEQDERVKETTEHAALVFQSSEKLTLQFIGRTVDVDEQSERLIKGYFNQVVGEDKNPMAITSYFVAQDGAYTSKQRLAYYRAMAVRNMLIEEGYSGDDVTVRVRHTENQDLADQVEIIRLR